MKKAWERFNKKEKILSFVIVLCVLVSIGLIVWDHIDPPLWYHFEAQKNKRVIMEYAEEHFPKAKIVEERYDSAIPFLTSNRLDQIVFEQDGVRFAIWANDGEFWGENYLGSKAIQYIEREIIEKYLNSKGITALYDCSMPYGVPTGEVTEFEGIIIVKIIPDYEVGKDMPCQVEWLYDFYEYWQSESNLKNYQVCIEYRVNDDLYYVLRFQEDSAFASAEEFYNAFRPNAP